MLNCMCSEAELAVGMRAIISSSKRANIPLLFAHFGDGIDTYLLYTRTADEPQKAVNRLAKGRLLASKRASFVR